MSSTYEPDIKIFYGPLDANHRLIPAPDVSISVEYNYSNDNIIGYTYIINLTGYITALDLRNLSYGEEIPSSPNQSIRSVIDHINKLRSILIQNGNILHIVKAQDNTPILRAKGGILRSFDITESPNNWVNFASYSASLEFHSVDFGSYQEDCSTTFLDPTGYNTDGIIDLSKFKIKSFNDSWSFTFDENESFKRVTSNDINNNLNINNHTFNLEYTISAVGKHVFNYDNETTGASTVLAAWEQAKNFVQDRLYNQVTSLITTILKDSYSSACSSTDGLDDILEPGSGEGLLKGVGDAGYKIFNEQISCEASESDGSFSATYSAIVKTTFGNASWSSLATKHTVNKSVQNSNSIGTKVTNISVNGTIEGLIEGGLIRTSGPINLPQNGSFLVYNNGGTTKYDNAKSLLDQLYSDDDYNGGIGENGKRDLKPSFKQALGITLDELGISSSPTDTIPDPPHPISFNLTHNYNTGTITYSAEYNSSKACGKKFSSISVQTSNPSKVIAVFNIPNSNQCPVVQELGTYTAKTVTLSIQGFDGSNNGQPNNLDLVQEINKELNLECLDEGYLPITLPPDGTYVITQRQYTRNPIDGSFTVNISYICNTDGCPI